MRFTRQEDTTVVIRHDGGRRRKASASGPTTTVGRPGLEGLAAIAVPSFCRPSWGHCHISCNHFSRDQGHYGGHYCALIRSLGTIGCLSMDSMSPIVVRDCVASRTVRLLIRNVNQNDTCLSRKGNSLLGGSCSVNSHPADVQRSGLWKHCNLALAICCPAMSGMSLSGTRLVLPPHRKRKYCVWYDYQGPPVHKTVATIDGLAGAPHALGFPAA